MSPTILSIVKENLKNCSTLNDTKITELIRNMELWKKNRTIYPSMIKSLLLLPTFKDTYIILDTLKDLGILRYGFQIYCSHCKKLIDGPLLESLIQFPEDLYCDCDCSYQLTPVKDTILVYVVIKDE